MNEHQPLQTNPTIFGIGALIGLALGLFIGWVLWPVEWQGATLRDLDTGTKAEYIAAVADAFAIYDNPEAAANARRRLVPVEENLVEEFSTAILYFRNGNQTEKNIRVSNIRQLANSLGILLPDPGFTAVDAQGEPLIAVAPTMATQGDGLPTTGIALPTPASSGNLSTAASNSWLRSLLWLLAIMLIGGGGLFLVSASGLLNWQSLMARWAALPTGNFLGGNSRRAEPELVDEVDEYYDLDDYAAFDDEEAFVAPTAEHLSIFQRQPLERGGDNTLRVGRVGAALGGQNSREDTLGFDAEAYSFADDPGLIDSPDGQVTWLDSDQSRYLEVGAAEGEDAGDDEDKDEVSSQTNAPEMFAPADFDDPDASTIELDYRMAHAGQRYADEGNLDTLGVDMLERAPSDRSAPDVNDQPDLRIDPAIEDDENEDDAFDDDDDAYDDDTVDGSWAVPTVDSVLASTSSRPPLRADKRVIEDAVTDSTDHTVADRRTQIQSDSATSEQPATSPFARLTNRNRQPANRIASRMQPQAKPAARTAQPAARVERPAQSPGHTSPARYKVIDQHMLQYQLGIQEYDESKPIVDPTSGKYIGEFGMGASVKNALLQANAEQVVAVEVWLFDKSDEQSIGNKTRILLSEYASDHKLDDVFLKERQDDPRPFTAQRGVHFQLESKNLLLDCMIVDVEYVDAGASKGMFKRLNVDMSVHQKG